MCVRYLKPEQLAELQQVVDELSVSVFRVMPETLAGGNIEACPGVAAPLVGMGRIFCQGTWGFGKWDGKGVVFNARCETLSRSPFFSSCVARGRCVVPALAYFEWSRSGGRRGDKYRIGRPDGKMLYMAGLARRLPGQPLEYTVVTREAAPAVREIHDRMPLLLDSRGIDCWLDSGCRVDDCIRAAGNMDVVAEKA